MKRYSLFLLTVLTIGLLSGCCSRQVVVYDRPPAPPPRVEVRTAPPCPRSVWVPGHWYWKGKRRGYVWVPGYWKRP